MKQTLIVLLSLCILASAVVPRNRRALDAEEQRDATTTEAPRICEPVTPCGWSTYNKVTKLITMNITNEYCVCGEGLVCRVYEDDFAANAYLLRCQPPEDNTVN